MEIDEVKLNFMVFCSPFLSVFQGENSTVADEDMLTREEFCSKTEKEKLLPAATVLGTQSDGKKRKSCLSV